MRDNYTAQAVIEKEEEVSFSWEKPQSMAQKIYVVIYNLKKDTSTDVIEIELSKPSMNYNVQIGDKKMTFYHCWKHKGVSKNVLLSEAIDEEMMDPINISSTVVRLPKVGISLIDGNRQARNELFYITMKGFEYLKNLNKDEESQQMRITYLNIDNTLDHQPIFPVILTPSTNSEHLDDSGLKMVDIYSTKASNESNISAYNMISFDVKPMTIKIEEAIIPGVMRMVKHYNNDSAILKHVFESKFSILRKELDDNYGNETFKIMVKENWLNKKGDEDSQQIYVNNLGISQININFSFQKEYGSKMNKKLFKGVMGFVSLLLTNIDGADFSFDPIVHTGSPAPMNSLKNIITMEYKNDAIVNTYRALGSLNFLGNPRKMASEFTEGFNDLVEKPLDNVDRNPIGVGTGLIEGTGSLAKHTTGAATGAFSRVSKSLADVAGFVVGDDAFNQKRIQMRYQKTEGIGGTMKKTATYIGNGFYSGVTGVVTQPIKYTREEGVTGAIKGTVYGVTGLFAKPVTGVLDAVSTLTGDASTGLKSQKFMANCQRMREPRAFYGQNLSIK